VTIPDDRLHAYVDGALDSEGRLAVEAAMQSDAELAARGRQYTEHRKLLRDLYGPVAAEPIPAGMRLKRPAWMQFARAAVFIAIGVAVGYFIPHAGEEAPRVLGATGSTSLAKLAANAHVVYSAEVRHPVEVEAAQQDHLVKWLSKRLGKPLRAPVLTGDGFELLGGRLLPGDEGPVAQFMYQDAQGKRLTLYLSGRGPNEPESSFRFARDGKVAVFYWVDRDWCYALSAEVERPALLQVANTVYKQLNP
jgi:anti-sigma factor RsiW